MACHDDRASGVFANSSRDGGTDTKVELGDGLTAGEHLVVGIAVPIGRPESLDIADEAHAVDVGTRIVLAEAGIDVDAHSGERLGDGLGRLDRALEVAGDEDVGGQLARLGQSFPKSLGLLTSQW